MGENFAETWQKDQCPPALKKMIFRTVVEEIIYTQSGEKGSAVHDPLEGGYAYTAHDGATAFGN